MLVVGPSGAGKDTLIRGAREALRHVRAVTFPTRIITRPPKPGAEVHHAVTTDEFDHLLACRALALHWAAYEYRYGLPQGIEDDLAAGRTVVANVSRAVIDEARRRYQPLQVIRISVPEAIRACRLAERGREHGAERQQRLARGSGPDVTGPDVLELDNGGATDDAIDGLVAMIVAALNCPADTVPPERTVRLRLPA